MKVEIFILGGQRIDQKRGMVERLREMRKGRTERIEKREKRERDKREGLPCCYLFKRVPILENFSEFGKIVNNSTR